MSTDDDDDAPPDDDDDDDPEAPLPPSSGSSVPSSSVSSGPEAVPPLDDAVDVDDAPGAEVLLPGSALEDAPPLDDEDDVDSDVEDDDAPLDVWACEEPVDAPPVELVPDDRWPASAGVVAGSCVGGVRHAPRSAPVTNAHAAVFRCIHGPSGIRASMPNVSGCGGSASTATPSVIRWNGRVSDGPACAPRRAPCRTLSSRRITPRAWHHAALLRVWRRPAAGQRA